MKSNLKGSENINKRCHKIDKTSPTGSAEELQKKSDFFKIWIWTGITDLHRLWTKPQAGWYEDTAQMQVTVFRLRTKTGRQTDSIQYPCPTPLEDEFNQKSHITEKNCIGKIKPQITLCLFPLERKFN